MNSPTLQAWIDKLHETSRQQSLLGLVTVLAPLGAILAVAAEIGRWWPFGLVVVPILALASAIGPDSHAAFLVIAVVAMHWVVTIDRVDTPWLPVASVCLLVYHAVNALTATFPTGGDVSTATIVEWLWRTMFAAGVTVAVWALVVLLDGRNAAGNGLLTALALAIVSAGAVVLRSGSIDESR